MDKAPLAVKIFVGIVAYSAWALMVYLGKADAQTFVAANQAILVGLGVYHVK